jgi:hypothetical protein
MLLDAKAAPRSAKVAGRLYPADAHRVNYAWGQKHRWERSIHADTIAHRKQ